MHDGEADFTPAVYDEEAREAARRSHARTRARSVQAQLLREALVAVLSPQHRCAICRARPRKHPLEIDHVDGRDWSPRATSQLCRARRYWREYRDGVRLRVLCRRCNARTWPDRQLRNALAAS